MRTQVCISIAGYILLVWCAADLAAAADLRLLEALKNQNRDSARALLREKIDVNTRGGDGGTALHWAAHWSDAEMTDALIRRRANVAAANDLGITPLHLASTNGNAVIVERLLAAGANPNGVTSTGVSALMMAARSGSLDCVNALLKRGTAINLVEQSRGQTALMWAVAQGHSSVVRALLENGADVHVRSHTRPVVMFTGDPSGGGRNAAELTETIPRGGSTALLFAARQGDIGSSRLLLAAGANANDAAPDGISALVMASHSGHGALAEFLLGKGADPHSAAAGYTALHAAVLRGDTNLVKALLAHAADPNAQIAKGTPVTREGQDYVLPNYLIGATPYFLAAKFAEADIMRVLAAGGADPRFMMKDGTTALMAAAGIGWGAGADRRDRAGLDAPTLEDEMRTLEAVKAALELGVGSDVSAASQAGDTALHGAAAKGFNSVIQFLADKDANLNARNKRGQTALALVIATSAPRAGTAYGQLQLQKTVDLLRKLGAQE